MHVCWIDATANYNLEIIYLLQDLDKDEAAHENEPRLALCLVVTVV